MAAPMSAPLLMPPFPSPSPDLFPFRMACPAMGTRFEVCLHGSPQTHLRAAAEEAFAEIRRLEGQLSVYLPTSDISFLNRQASRHPVRVEPRLFNLLEEALALVDMTQGAFDPTVGPLIEAWGMRDGSGNLPDERSLGNALACTGAGLIHLDTSQRTVFFRRPGVVLNLASIGKGYALDQAASLLTDMGIPNGLIHGGTSTMVAWGKDPHGNAWQVALGGPDGSQPEMGSSIETILLRDESLSASAPWGRGSHARGRFWGHVLDPRTGYPVEHAHLAAVALPSATRSDALATALMVLGESGIPHLHNRFPEARFWLHPHRERHQRS